MNFTREPIIETIITPKEGFKLILRNSHGTSQEEFSVCSVEVVSFGSALFYRSLEKPKPLLLPISDYEVLEARETRTVLKKAQIEKSIKIGGGKIPQKPKEQAPQASVEEEEEFTSEAKKHQHQKKPSRNNRKPGSKKPEQSHEEHKHEHTEPLRRTLLPPPTSLISEQISRYKEYLTAEGTILPEEKQQKQDITFVPETSAEEKVVDLNEEAHTSSESDEKS